MREHASWLIARTPCGTGAACSVPRPASYFRVCCQGGTLIVYVWLIACQAAQAPKLCGLVSEHRARAASYERGNKEGIL